MQETFSRKFNAQRHNKIVHGEMAMVYDNETDWKSSIKKMSKQKQKKEKHMENKVERIEKIWKNISLQF
jgi:hypothetical protein